MTSVMWMPLLSNCKTEISECVHYDTPFLSFCLKNVLMLICMKVLLAEKVGVSFVIPLSFGGCGGQHIGVDRTLIKSGTVSYTQGVLLPRGLLLALQKQVQGLPVPAAT